MMTAGSVSWYFDQNIIAVIYEVFFSFLLFQFCSEVRPYWVNIREVGTFLEISFDFFVIFFKLGNRNYPNILSL